ncbi:TPA: FAD-containing oxidoreductase [Streptococcus suis]
MQYDLIVIGFGKAGKTLAGKMAQAGQKVALIEQDPAMNGGTCINIACIPTKTLIHAVENHLSFQEAMALKDVVVQRLNQKNTVTLTDKGVDLYQAKARFISNHQIQVTGGDQDMILEAKTILINTGAKSRDAGIEGLTSTPGVYDSTGIQRLKDQPQSLAVIGGGNIGLEFASLYAQLGTQVTVYENSSQVLSRYEPEVAQLAKDYLEEDGVQFVLDAKVSSVQASPGGPVVVNGQDRQTYDAVLYALGRIPNTQDLGLENTDIQLTDRGAIQVDDHLQTTVAGVYAAGDVTGGLQFTYTSLDDYRIIYGHLSGSNTYALSDRRNVPTSLFINPPIAQVGLTEAQAKEKGLSYQAKSQAVATMPKAHVNNQLRGLYKVIVDPETKLVLGATLMGENSHEIINLIKMAMDNLIPYTYIANQVFTHPTFAENFNDVFAF